MQQAASVEPRARAEVSIYWKPGCSSCLKAKEFVEEQGIAYESINVIEDEQAMQEVLGAGLRSIPVVRKGSKYIYAQSLDEVAGLLGISRDHVRLPHDQLLERWDTVLDRAKVIISAFSAELLERPAIAVRQRSIKEVCSHIFQINEAFLMSLEDETVDARALGTDPRDSIVTKADLIEYIEAVHTRYRNWLSAGGLQKIPERMPTYYGEQASGQVLERAVWHSAQHARQLDHVAAGLGAELEIPAELYAGLPMPKRLWA